jgi:hypothetical protein
MQKEESVESVYVDTFECPLCQVPQQFCVFGLAEPVEPKVREKAAGLAKHYHWCDVHRVCAKCGKYVKPDELELAVNNGYIPIHDAYTNEYHKIQHGDISYLLIVHRQCMPSEQVL